MIKGVITTKDVLANSLTIVDCFGFLCLLRCCAAALRQEPTTFLACVYPPGAGALAVAKGAPDISAGRP